MAHGNVDLSAGCLVETVPSKGQCGICLTVDIIIVNRLYGTVASTISAGVGFSVPLCSVCAEVIRIRS